MINWGPGSLAIVWFGSSLTPSPPLLSVSSTNDTQEDWEREKIIWREGGGDERGAKLYGHERAWSSINHSILSFDNNHCDQPPQLAMTTPKLIGQGGHIPVCCRVSWRHPRGTSPSPSPSSAVALSSSLQLMLQMQGCQIKFQLSMMHKNGSVVLV